MVWYTNVAQFEKKLYDCHDDTVSCYFINIICLLVPLLSYCVISILLHLNDRRWFVIISARIIYQYLRLVYLQVKLDSVKDVHRPSREVVEEFILDHADPELPAASRPKMGNLIRNTNRTRQRLRPADPTDLDFEVFIISVFNLHTHKAMTL